MDEERRKEARILVVDDEPQNVRYVMDVLEWAGYENIEGVSSPLEAVERFRQASPDLVILDLLMPELDGFGVMETIQAGLPDDEYVPFLILTSDISSDSRRRALSSGAKDFLTKPMSPTEVRLRVDNLLETRFLYLECERQADLLNALTREHGATDGEASLELLERWGDAIDAGSGAGKGRARRVSWLCGRIAQALELPERETELLRRAALLSGLGSRRGPVGSSPAQAERDGSQPDPEAGARLLEGASLPVLEKAREMLSAVAERWDGSGEPAGLRGRAVPLSARIAAVALHYDHLVNGGPGLEPSEAVGELEGLAGSRFDPGVVAALLRMEPVGA